LRKAIIILLIYLILPTQCFAGAASVIAKTCETWNQHIQADDSSAIVDEAWLIGYLSGISTSADIDFIKMIDTDSIKSWVDNYCQAHPLKLLEDAGQTLAQELMERKHQDKQ
jgi:hypothetical protein